MRFTTLSIAALAAVANANTVRIAVGLDGNISYTPPNATANVNDTLQFIFYPMNHSVIESSFSEPCTPKAGGFYSGFINTAGAASTINTTTFEVQVNTSGPIWFYCGQLVGLNHCNTGMVGAINANATGNATYADFLAASADANVTDPLNNTAVGGTWVAFNASNSTNSTNGTTNAPASSNAVATVGSLSTALFGVVAAAVAFAL